MIDINSTIQVFHSEEEEVTYKVLSLLGEGKFSVYEVSDSSNNQFAMKVFPINSSAFNEEARFGILSHSHLVTPLKTGHFTIQSWMSEYEAEEVEYMAIFSKKCSNGTLFDVLINRSIKLDEKMTRTYFRKLVELVEFMHQNGVAHGDIKLENIFLDEKFMVNLADFDLSYKEGDKQLSRGTINWRAYEVKAVEKYNPFLADICSLAISLFAMHNGFSLPFEESNLQSFWDFHFDNQKYWRNMKIMMKCDDDIWSEDFKELFVGMTRMCPDDRMNFDKIKKSAWFCGEIYSDEEVSTVMTENTRQNQL